jgi:ATPase subunit of ABC transporter with duplicated ATPase domains
MADTPTIVRFNKVSFKFGDSKIILDGVDFSVRKGMKIALMGQNGAGKTTIFNLMTGRVVPESGDISVDHYQSVAVASQIVGADDRELTVEAYFHKYTGLSDHELKRRISSVLTVVNLVAPLEKLIKSFSGGQQARLLLAGALIQNPDILLLDEPTNNLDYQGIVHLTNFLVNYPKSCIVISHDADFLNAFTQGVLYLDTHTHQVEQYQGNYYDVVTEIASRIEKERRQNALMDKQMQENKEKANYFANKGGKMRLVAKKMREKVELYESEKVAVRREDKTIRDFIIPAQTDVAGNFLTLNSVTIFKNQQPTVKKVNIVLGRNKHLLITGPNGIGKSTLLESLSGKYNPGAVIDPRIKIGYYRQDFSTLDFKDTIHQSLSKALFDSQVQMYEEQLRATAAGFLITSDLMNTPIAQISEGLKGLVSFARLVITRPGLLIMDEPTNHINFRHLPVIARALDEYEGALILVSHIPEFVGQIRIDEELDLDN